MPIIPNLNTIQDGLSAQSLRMDVSMSNVANMHTTKTPEGGPYKRKDVVFESYMPDGNKSHSVRVSKIQEDNEGGILVYDPNHPHANDKGMVEMPNVRQAEEMVKFMQASRTHEALGVYASQSIKLTHNLLNIGR